MKLRRKRKWISSFQREQKGKKSVGIKIGKGERRKHKAKRKKKRTKGRTGKGKGDQEGKEKRERSEEYGRKDIVINLFIFIDFIHMRPSSVLYVSSLW